MSFWIFKPMVAHAAYTYFDFSDFASSTLAQSGIVIADLKPVLYTLILIGIALMVVGFIVRLFR